jgi:hypothetical protein
MDKLNKLAELCKAGLTISINDNRTVYESVEDTLRDVDDCEVKSKCIELNNLVEIHAYKDTPVGHFYIFHHDIEAAIDEALEVIEKD